jgi:hypothetical protein
MADNKPTIEDEREDDDLEVSLEDDDLQIEVEDDTPEEDRNRQPLPKDLVKELEDDELGEYSDAVKQRLKQFKKVWHDERREKEKAAREQQEALSFANRVLEENKRLKGTLTQGEQALISSWGESANSAIEVAKREYKEAYESGDSDKLLDAQTKLNDATYRANQVKGYRPTLQATEENVVSPQQQPNIPRPDSKTLAWQERNGWWGTDPEMTASALGLHQKLQREHGDSYVGSEEYWQTVDKTMKRRFPEYYDGDDDDAAATETPRKKAKAANVVAPASRSTSPRKVVLKASQLAIARKLGLTPKQYAEELVKMESN